MTTITANDRSTAFATAERLKSHLARHQKLADRILRQLLITLHNRGIVSVDRLYAEAEELLRERGVVQRPEDSGMLPRSADPHRDAVHEITRDYAVRYLKPHEIDDVVNLTIKREEIQSLADIANLPSVSFGLLVGQLRRFASLPIGETQLDLADVMGLRVALIKHFISDQLEFVGIAKHYITIRDFDELTRRIIGPDHGMGRIGGKAAGMYLAWKILTSPQATPDPMTDLAIPESWYLRSDVIEQVLDYNNLHELRTHKYRSPEEIREEYPLIRAMLRNVEFPEEVVEQLRLMLEQVGTHPLIIRSSSLLEDRLGVAFSGKYASVFVPNQGHPEERLRALLTAIGEVYASTLAPDPIAYRREHNLLDYNEDMAVLIQKVVGRRVGRYFLPAFAGVAFSRNEYRWSPRIRREDGLLRLVMGLGTRAVERVGAEYPRMVALGFPTLRPEAHANEIIKRAQRTVDAINLEANRFESVPLEALLSAGEPFPMLDHIVSIYREGALYPPTTAFVDAPPDQLHVTFDKLLAGTDFPATMRQILTRLERAYGVPVDVEFAHDGERLYILQCRSLSQSPDVSAVRIPRDLPQEDIVFTANRFVRTGLARGIEYVVYVDPQAYDELRSTAERINVGRIVGRLNDRLADRRFILIGPGRWGTNDLRLGVRVSYADINHARMLIEIARRRGGYVPEVSFGTHFFQDLVEANILYLPLYPDEPGNVFNEDFFLKSPNALPELLPAAARFEPVVRVIHVPGVSGGRSLTVAMDGDADRAVAYLARDE